ncbi:MLP-like protein, partial [Mya arenaria]
TISALYVNAFIIFQYQASTQTFLKTNKETCHSIVSTSYFHIVDGDWGQWGLWDACSVSCGTGYNGRFRKCDSPAPMHGGSDCAGTSVGYRDCVMDPCPVDGGWGSWGHWSTCSVTCGVGTQLRHRSCTHPAPQHGGISCVGSPTSQKQCTHNDCPFTCPTHWVLNGSSCYYVSTTIHAWSYGKHYCKAHNSFLVEIDNSTEDSFILHELSIHHIDMDPNQQLPLVTMAAIF